MSQQVRPLPVHTATWPTAPGSRLVRGALYYLQCLSDMSLILQTLCHRTSSKQNSLKQLPSLQVSFLAWLAEQHRNGYLSTLLNDNEYLNTTEFVAKLEPRLARLTVTASAAKGFKKAVQEEVYGLTNDKTMQDVCAPCLRRSCHLSCPGIRVCISRTARSGTDATPHCTGFESDVSVSLQ